MSIAAVATSSLLSLLDNVVTTNSTTTPTVASTQLADSATADAPNSASTSTSVLAQDMVALLKALMSGDTTGAKSDLAKLKTDLSAQTAPSSSSLGKDMSSLLKDLTSGNATAAKSDISKVKTDLNASVVSDSTATQAASPLEALISKMSTSLSNGSVQGALQDLASYLVQSGQGTGSVVDTFA